MTSWCILKSLNKYPLPFSTRLLSANSGIVESALYIRLRSELSASKFHKSKNDSVIITPPMYLSYQGTAGFQFVLTQVFICGLIIYIILRTVKSELPQDKT